MASNEPIIALKADPDDPEDGDVTEEALERALAERRERRRMRGAQVAPVKKPISLRVDEDVLARFKADGDGWQTRMNAALRKAVGL